MTRIRRALAASAALSLAIHSSPLPALARTTAVRPAPGAPIQAPAVPRELPVSLSVPADLPLALPTPILAVEGALSAVSVPASQATRAATPAEESIVASIAEAAGAEEGQDPAEAVRGMEPAEFEAFAGRLMDGAGEAGATGPGTRFLAGLAIAGLIAFTLTPPRRPRLEPAPPPIRVGPPAPTRITLDRGTLDALSPRYLSDSRAGIVSGRIGLSPERAAEVAALGSQGEEGTCARYGLAGCAMANGLALALDVVKRVSGEYLMESYAAVLSRAAKPIEDDPDLLLVSTLLERALADPNSVGLAKKEVLAVADRLGAGHADLDPEARLDALVDRAVARIKEDERDRDEASAELLALAPSADLPVHAAVLERLRAGQAVYAAYFSGNINQDGLHGRHAVTVLAHGLNAAGEEVLEVFDSGLGRVRTMLWASFHPAAAIVFGPPAP